jgi:hypothetical protein
MGIHDQITSAFQDIVAPALHDVRGDLEDRRGRRQDRRCRRLAALEARRT